MVYIIILLFSEHLRQALPRGVFPGKLEFQIKTENNKYFKKKTEMKLDKHFNKRVGGLFTEIRRFLFS